MAGRPRLLFLAYYFPPGNAIGAVRTWGIARHLARLGWSVRVVTVDPTLWREPERAAEFATELDAEGIERVGTHHSWRFLSPVHLRSRRNTFSRYAGAAARRLASGLGLEPEIGWYRSAAEVCHAMDPNEIDVILASGSPFSAFRLARDLGRRMGKPYVLDYRDAWSGNPHSRRRSSRRTIRYEADLITGAAAVAAVSQSLGKSIEKRFRTAKVRIITNGFDRELMTRVVPAPVDHFSIVYGGEFYPPKRSIEPFMAVLKMLDAEPLPDWKFHYFGRASALVRSAAERWNLENRIVVHGFQPRETVLSAMRSAGIALVITSTRPTGSLADRGVLTGKLFDAIGLGVTTLVIAPEGSDTEAILEIAGCGRRYSGDDVAGMAAYIRGVIGGDAPPARDRDAFSWDRIGGSYDDLLRVAVSGGCS
jgi:glycosyltransferase involved in cell wall biosynthesis